MNTEEDEFRRIEREQAMRAVPDAIHHTDTSESLEYIAGWNDCRAAMLEQPAPQPEQPGFQALQEAHTRLQKRYGELEAQRRPMDVASAIEYADSRWAGVDVPIQWCRHFADALQTAQQKPVGRFIRFGEKGTSFEGYTVQFFGEKPPPPDGALFFTTQQAQRPWVGLTDEEIVAKALHLSGLGTSPDVIQFAQAIEAQLKKNNT